MLEAFALCPGSLPVIGTACTAVSGAVGSAAGAGLSAGVGAVFSEASRWVAGGAVWLIAQVGRAMSATTSIDLDTAWFGAHEAVMATLAAAVVLPMSCCAAIQAVYRQSASMLLRTFFVNLPLSLLFTGVAVTLVRMALAVTDAMSARILSSAGVDTTNLLSGLFTFLVPSAVASAFTIPSFVVFIGGLLVASAAFVLWLELVVRAAAVSVAVLFLPLALAALVWPSVAHWCRRLADTLVALVLSKLVIAAVLSLAAGALAGGLGSSGSAGGSGGGGGGGFAAVVTGIALLVVATLSPFTLLRLVPAVEAGAVGHLESTRQRLKSAAVSPVRSGGNLALEQMRQMKSDADGGDAAAVGTVGTEGSGVGAAVGATATAATAGAAAGPSAAAAGAGAAGAGAGAGGGAGGSGAAGGVGSSGASAISMVTGVAVAPESGFAGGSGDGPPPVPHAGATPRPAGGASSGDASSAGAAVGQPGTAGGAARTADAARVVPTSDDAAHGDG